MFVYSTEIFLNHIFNAPCIIGVRGSLERDISSLRAFGEGGGQISRVVHVSARAPFGVFAESNVFMHESATFRGSVAFLLCMNMHFLRKSYVFMHGNATFYGTV